MSPIHQANPIPLSKLRRSAANVRKTGREADLDQLAASIQAHGLIHPLTVTPEIGQNGEPTGRFGVIAGGRRLDALKLLVKRKALKKTALIPCVQIAGEGGTEVSLAENVTHLPMHPADQYEAFAALHAAGLSAADIGARFGRSERGVAQLLRLGAASPRLLALYREEELNLNQLTAFCVTDDHAAQERVWDALSYNKEPYYIRRLLTEEQVSLHDRRAVFVGLEAYEAAGGGVMRDLFSEDGEGHLTDPALLESLVTAKLAQRADEVRAEGWKWVNVSVDLDHQETAATRRVYPRYRPLSDDDQTRLDEIERELERLSGEEDDAEAEGERLEAEIEALRGEATFDPADIARGGAWVYLDWKGKPSITRGLIRPEDIELEMPGQPGIEDEGERGYAAAQILTHPAQGEEAEEDGAELPGRLLSDLTAHRTAALRDSLAANPQVAYLAVLHAMVLQCFYWGDSRHSCLEITTRQTRLEPYADNIAGNPGHTAQEARHQRWTQRLPEEAAELWTFLTGQTEQDRAELLAHCAAQSLESVQRPGDIRSAKHTHADQLAAALALDMTAYWQPTAESYFNRITKAQIVDSMRDAKIEGEANRMNGMKKPDMAVRAENLLKGKGWLPHPLRQPERLEAEEEADAA